MPMTKEEKKEYNRLHYLKNKEKKKEEMRLYRNKHTEEIKQYYIENKEKLNTDRYNTKTTRCLDHDHSITDRFNVRYVLCNSCNVKLG